VKEILSKGAPAPVGPYSQAIVHDGLVYLSGLGAFVPRTGEMRGKNMEEQGGQLLAMMSEVLSGTSYEFDKLLRVGVYLAKFLDLTRFNEVYGRAIGAARPARSTIEVSALPLGARIEIDAVAVAPG